MGLFDNGTGELLDDDDMLPKATLSIGVTQNSPQQPSQQSQVSVGTPQPGGFPQPNAMGGVQQGGAYPQPNMPGVQQGAGSQQVQQNAQGAGKLVTGVDAAIKNTSAGADLKPQVKKEREVKNRYKYVVATDNGKNEKGFMDAASADDVRNFLISQNYKVLEVKERDKMDIDIGSQTLKAGDLSFMLTQLSTYIRAGIPLADSVRILAKQAKKPNLRKSYNELVYQLLKGDSLSTAMELQNKVYPKMLINMIKTSEMTGDLPSILDDMSEYYTSMDQTKKQMKSAMTYPAVVLTLAFAVLIFMLTYLVPQFSTMFSDNGASLPLLTQMILNISGFLTSYWYILLIILIGGVGGFIYCFKKIQPFKRNAQFALMHIPVVKNIIIYNEIANFTKTFASLLNHGVFITDSMEILSKVTNNEIFKEIINNTLVNLAKGDTISAAFKGHWAVPVVAYEMIVTGESTGQLGVMMEKVASHYQLLHKNTIDQMKSLIEPIMIVALAGIVGVILVSIVQPMFSIYSAVG